MPFTSLAQQRYMFSQHPRIARKMANRMKAKGQKFATKKNPTIRRK